MTKRATQLVVLMGAILLIAGSLMTWISVDVGFAEFSSTGTDNIEGKLTAGAGVVLVLVGLAFTRDDMTGRVAGYLALAAAAFGGIVLLLEYLDVRERIAETDPATATATVGLGVWVTAVGAIAAIGAVATSLIRERP